MNNGEKENNCQAFVTVKISALPGFNKHENKKYYRNRATARKLQRKFRKEFKINFLYDHLINVADFPRRKLVNDATKEKFLHLFGGDLMPSSAWRRH